MIPESEHHNVRRTIDWEDLRARSLNPGGFGSDRVRIWTRLLNVIPSERQSDEVSGDITQPDTSPHHDERQIGLDTDRSFVLYPVDSEYDREALQADLRALLVSLFRKRPRLNYFQGYHDIASVIFLTMPEELRFPCIEKISLHRLRDSMGAGLEPVLGLLRVTKNLIRLKDQPYADVLERNAPLPFHALSNLLTLFSHDVPTLPLIQHVFDYLLCRPPIMAVYLAAAVILSRKQDVLRMEEEGDDGMIHSLLSGLPNLVDGNEAGESTDSDPSIPTDPSLLSLEPGNGSGDDQIISSPVTQETRRDRSDSLCETVRAVGSTEKDVLAPSASNYQSAGSENNSASVACSQPSIEIASASEDDGISLDQSRNRSAFLSDGKSSAPNGGYISGDEKAPVVNVVHDPPPYIHLLQSRQQSHFQTVLLSNLLREADALHAQFPPSHPDLHLSSIMGPQSVIFTWSESFSELPPDAEAEAMIQHPNLIVYPYVDIEQEMSSESSEYEEKIQSRWRQKGKERLKAGVTKLKKRTKKHTALGRAAYPQVDKGTVVAGAVLVLGVAVAVYGIKTRSGNANGLFLSFANTREHASVQTQDWKRVGGWMSGALTKVGEKVIGAFGKK